MALNLFVNFENTGNSSIFYRTLSSASTHFDIKIKDPQTNENLSNYYTAEFSINHGDYEDFDETNGIFSSHVIFNTTSPCVCAITARVYRGNTITNTFTMSGKFVSSFPTIDFIAYPNTYIDENTKKLSSLDASSYFKSPGLKFYGEGHTETIQLSCNGVDENSTVTWFIGNSGSSTFTNEESLINVDYSSGTTAAVDIPTTLGDTSSYQISVKLNNATFPSYGPAKTYKDGTGEIAYYPFFSSSVDPKGNILNNNLKSNIQVLTYPLLNPPTFLTPFSATHFSLPLDHSLQTFRSSIYNYKPRNFLTENFVGTQWEIKAVADIGEWSLETVLLSSMFGYQFQLSYDETASEIILPTFNTSSIVPTTVTLSVSSFKDVYINFPPYDWQIKRVHYDNKASTVIGPLPFAKLYIPNFYYLKGQDVPITIIETPPDPFNLESLTITSTHSTEILILSGTALSGIMHFNKAGGVELNATAIIRNPITGLTQSTTIILPDMIEIVRTFDMVDENYFQTSMTPLTLTYNELPRLSPNEWAIADNVNSIIEKIYTVTEDLNQYTKLYENVSKLYGWIGPARRYPKDSVVGTMPTYIWTELECDTTTASEEAYTWASFECTQENPFVLWQYHECETSHKKIDPTCMQKHCLDWRWKLRKQGASKASVTWKLTKANGPLAKRWAYEQCVNDSEILNCNRDTWKIATIDPLSYPLPFSTSVLRCQVVDVEPYAMKDQLLIAHPTEINLLDNNYQGELIARRGTADEQFSFQNIVGLATNFEGKAIALDSTLCRICVFDITEAPVRFELFTTWGTYGAADNPRGFSKPQDIHVDANNSLWIADTGNNCIKKLTILGKHLMTITHEKLTKSAPLSICVDSQNNIHCLTDSSVIVFDEYGEYSFEYFFPAGVTDVSKINCSYNREMMYVTYSRGIIKFFRTGMSAYYLAQDIATADGGVLHGYISTAQDKYRNLYATVGDKILKIADLQQIVDSKANISENLYWSLKDLYVHKEEYIQPWVYLKSFHRLWDNIELLRNSLNYEATGCKSYTKAVFSKEELVIGQNEIVTNAVINRLSEQVWTNLQSLINYFDPNCEK